MPIATYAATHPLALLSELGGRASCSPASAQARCSLRRHCSGTRQRAALRACGSAGGGSAADKLDERVPRTGTQQGRAGRRKQCAARVEREESARAGRLQGAAAARGGPASGRAALVQRTSAPAPWGVGERAGRARRARRARDARSACAYRVRDAARKTRSRAVAGALQATRGEEGQGAWHGAGSVELGLARRLPEADV